MIITKVRALYADLIPLYYSIPAKIDNKHFYF